MGASDEVLFFPDPAAFRAWLKENHARVAEQWVGFYKRGSGKPSITWPESVDQALCFGWIDGVRKTIDAQSYKIRFTPRKRGSVWSAINIRRAKALIEAGEMTPAGLKAFEARRSDRSALYSYEQRRNPVLPAAFAKKLKSDKAAWAFFRSQPPWYQRSATHWVISAKQEETRLRRLETLMEDSRNGRAIAPLRRPARPQR